MKLRILTTALVLAAVTSAPASAMISKKSVTDAINFAANTGSLSSVVNGDTVTLFGVVDGDFNANKAKQAALSVEGVNKVIDLISVSR